MFCDKDFADGANAAQSSGSAAAAIVAIATAVTVADKKRSGNSGVQLTSDINGLLREGLIIETVSGPIADGRRKIA
jgi:hypothetical protein